MLTTDFQTHMCTYIQVYTHMNTQTQSYPRKQNDLIYLLETLFSMACEKEESLLEEILLFWI